MSTVRRNSAGYRGLVFAGALCVACVFPGRARELAFDLTFLAGEGCVTPDEGVRLWPEMQTADNTSGVYLEAEDAENISFRAKGGVRRAADCSGGSYVVEVTHAEFPFRIGQGGTVRGWARTYLPFKANWNHTESMDGGAEKRVSESDAGVFGRWVWTPLGTYRLAAGEHRFVLHNWLGGARLDALMFSADPAFDPSGLGGYPSADPAAGGQVRSVPLRPAPLAGLVALDLDAALNGGQVIGQISCDEGKTWQGLPAGGRLDHVPVAGDGTDVVMARFTLVPAPDGKSPVLHGAALVLRISDADEVVLSNRWYELVFSRGTGALTGIVHKSARVSAVPLGFQESVLGLAVRERSGGSVRVLEPHEIVCRDVSGDSNALALRFAALDGRVSLVLRVSADDSPLSRWELTVSNRSDVDVVRVDFPRLGRIAVGDPADDECVIPHTGGRRVKNPSRGKRWVSTYLGGGAMAWMDVCDSAGGVYVSVQDPALTTTEMICEPSAQGDGADLLFRTHTLVAPGGERTRRAVVGVHAGDWHWAADTYRAWASTWLKPPDNPDWVRWCDGWVGAMGVPFSHMGSRLAQGRHEGLSYLQYWGQMADGIDQCCGNFYWPAPELGGDEGFIRGVEEVHRAGGRVSAYMNCQTWTRDSAVNDALRNTPKSDLPEAAVDLIHPVDWFEKWRLYPADGEPLGYNAQTMGWYIMCPAATGFREHLRFWIVDMYAGRYRMDGVYLDQTGATRAKPCYCLDHGHDDIGAWGMGNVKLLETCVREAREINPDFIMAIEGAGDALGQFASLHLISGLCTDPEVYHYTFPEHILISGKSNRSDLSALQRISRAFLNGDRFDSRLGDRYMISAIQLRKRIKWWLYPARFMDTVGMTVSDSRVLGRWNVCDAETGRALVLVFDNEEAVADATVELAVPSGFRSAGSAITFDREGGVSVSSVDLRSGVLRMPISASTLSAVLIPLRIAGEHCVDLWAGTPGAVRTGDTIEATVLNLGSRSRRVEFSTSVPSGSPLSVSSGPVGVVSLDSLSARTVRLTVSGTDRLVTPTSVEIRGSWEDGARSVRVLFRPLLLNPGLDRDDDGNDDPDYWTAGGTSTVFNRGIENGAAWIQGKETEYLYFIQHLPLKPRTRYRFSCRIRRQAECRGVSAAVVEFLEDKGLRMHRAGVNPSVQPGTWESYSLEFETGETFRDTAIYLYNTHSTVKAWYDDIELVELGQADPNED